MFEEIKSRIRFWLLIKWYQVFYGFSRKEAVYLITAIMKHEISCLKD